MNAEFSNVYNDNIRADAYAELEFPGTYYLAYRDLPDIFDRHVTGNQALDFGCGTGRSARFLHGLGFKVLGVDISEQMLIKARERDPAGDYRQVPDGDLSDLPAETYDLILSAFTFDNIPTMQRKLNLFGHLGQLLKPGGRIVNLVSAPEIYLNEWASFSTRDYPENHKAKSGDIVRIVMLDVGDKRPVEDIIWMETDYRDLFRLAGLKLIEVFRPLARETEPFNWVSETEIPPWTIYVLGRDN